MAAVLLKRHVKEHWAEESKHFKQPVVSDSEKAAIRSQLPQGLADTQPKLRTAVSMAIAAIAKWDLPDAWPGLLNLLMGAVTSKVNQDLGMQLHAPHTSIRHRLAAMFEYSWHVLL